MSNTKSKPVLHTITTPDGVVHTRKSPRVYAVAIVVEYDPVKHSLWFAQHKRQENESSLRAIAKYEAGLATAGDARVEIRNERGNYENTLWSKADYLGWIKSAREGIATRDAEIAVLLATAADATAKPTYLVHGWSQTEKQGHATARTITNQWVTAQGGVAKVVAVTRHA
jgi:hypothetical protein